MLEKKVPFCIDHFSIATTHRDRPIDLVTKLGFTTADCYTDRTVHFIFENSYFELCTYQLNTTITWLTQSVPATNLPKVHSYRLSVKGTDPNPMRNALIEGGIETIGEINNPFRQHVRYGEKEGEAGYQTFFIQNYEPFTDILFGCTTHLAKELIVKNETKFPHITAEHYTAKSRDIDIIKLNGSIELAPILGLSDVIVDIVETGKTLLENHLAPLETIVDNSAWLISSRVSYQFKHQEIAAMQAALARKL